MKDDMCAHAEECICSNVTILAKVPLNLGPRYVVKYCPLGDVALFLNV